MLYQPPLGSDKDLVCLRQIKVSTTLVLIVFGARKTAHAEKVFLFLLMTSLRFYQ